MPIITPVSNTSQAATAASTASATTHASDARARAIAKIVGQNTLSSQPANSQSAPVSNPNQVTPEELSAINPPSIPESKAPPEEGLSHSNEAVEPKVEATDEKATSSEDEALSPKFAVLARKEKQLRAKAVAQEQAFKAREAQLAEREAQMQAKSQEYDKGYVSKDRLVNDPWNTLQEIGLTYEQLTQMALNPPPQQDAQTKAMIAELKGEIKALKDGQEKVTKNYQESQSQAYQDAINQLKAETSHLVDSDPSYETIKSTNSVGDVVDLIERTWKEEKRLMTVEEAAQEVENFLLDEAMKLTRLKKIQERLKPKQETKPAEAPKQDNKQQPQQTQMKTLTNAVGAGRQLSVRERAILAFQGKLNQS